MIIICLSILDMGLNKLISWKKYPGSRFFLQMIFGTAISLLCLNFSYFEIREWYTFSNPETNQIIVMNLYGSALILPIFSIYFGYQFLKDWRKSELESERLLKENARSQMMTLKNHLDPHFLFNNLNILSSLMDKDTQLSKKYLDKFAEVYRIILKSEQSDLVTLEEEMRLVHSYNYLLGIRFGKSVIFDLNIDQSDLDKALPPLSIQMLIENAIKHNMANEANPITIQIKSSENSILTIQNNVRKKKYDQNKNIGSGLKNIQNRYEFFSDREVVIEETNENFTVFLPLLEIDYS